MRENGKGVSPFEDSLHQSVEGRYVKFPEAYFALYKEALKVL
jgi:hypothetical protein